MLNNPLKVLTPKMTNQPPTTCIVFGTQHAHACIVAATSFVALMPAVQLVLKKKSHSFSARMRLGYPHVLYNTGTNHRLKKHPSCMANPFHLLGMNQPVQGFFGGSSTCKYQSVGTRKPRHRHTQAVPNTMQFRRCRLDFHFRRKYL